MTKHRPTLVVAVIGAVCAAAVAAATPAAAEPQHNSSMTADATLQNQADTYIPPSQAYLSGSFVAKRGTTVRISCWTTGAQADGQGKWFWVTAVGGTVDGATGYVPASRVGNQWKTSPRC